MSSLPPARVVDLSEADVEAGFSQRSLRLVLIWLAAWTAVVVGMAALVSAQKAIPLRYTLPSEALNYYTLALVSLVVWIASARMDARKWSAATQAAAHIGLGLVLVPLWQSIYGMYLRAAMGPRAYDALVRGTWMFQFMNAGVIYAGVVCGTLAIQAARRARAQEQRQHALTLLARDAELQALTAQLEPHFLLNALNSVVALVDTNPRDARAMLERLADLLKAAFDEMQEHEVTLGRELDLIEAYLGIEQVRFADRLRVSVDVPSTLRSVTVPPFLLQPLVENAVRHAVGPSTTPAAIAVRAKRDGANVRISVTDSGPGFDREDGLSRGHGLRLTERRLQAFASTGQLLVERAGSGGAVVSLVFPG